MLLISSLFKDFGFLRASVAKSSFIYANLRRKISLRLS